MDYNAHITRAASPCVPHERPRVRIRAKIATAFGLCKSGLPVGVAVVTITTGFSVLTAHAQSQGKSYPNPLGSVTDILVVIKNIIHYLFLVSIPLAVLGIIISGLLYVYAAASGDASKATTAKKTFTYVLIGCVFVVGALALAEAIIQFFKDLK